MQSFCVMQVTRAPLEGYQEVPKSSSEEPELKSILIGFRTNKDASKARRSLVTWRDEVHVDQPIADERSILSRNAEIEFFEKVLRDFGNIDVRLLISGCACVVVMIVSLIFIILKVAKEQN